MQCGQDKRGIREEVLFSLCENEEEEILGRVSENEWRVVAVAVVAPHVTVSPVECVEGDIGTHSFLD